MTSAGDNLICHPELVSISHDYEPLTTHHSLIHNDTVFSRFTSHFSLEQTNNSLTIFMIVYLELE